MKVKILAVSLTAAFILWGPALMAQKRKNIPSEKPQLIIGIVVESMRYDYIHRYWDNFGEGGFRRLIGEGAFCRNANYNYMLTQTSPGYATIATGCEPIVHGIVSDAWYVQLQEKNIGAAFDEKVKPVGAEIDKGTYSPRNILTTTFTDEMKLFSNNRSKVFAVSLNPTTAVLPAGHIADAAYWFDDASGLWVTSSYYADSLPTWVNEFNGKKFPDMYIEKDWLPLLPP